MQLDRFALFLKSLLFSIYHHGFLFYHSVATVYNFQSFACVFLVVSVNC